MSIKLHAVLGLALLPGCAAAELMPPDVAYSSSSYIRTALGALPEIRSAEETVRIARNNYENAFITAFLPTASLSFGTDIYDNASKAWRLRKDEVDSTASVNWNLFNTGRDSVALKSASVSLEQAELSLKQLKQSKSSTALNKFYALLSDSKLLVVAQQDLADKERQHALSKRLHEEGFKGMADLLQSENNLKSSQLSLAQAEASRFKSLIDFNTYINREPESEAELSYNQQQVQFVLPQLAEDISYMLVHHMDIR
ncbi:MAG TPA: TolC family protein, partial [Elusimicrobiales bacterium]|nr:TolC family protein [Elusimicrobiales bacterium]